MSSRWWQWIRRMGVVSVAVAVAFGASTATGYAGPLRQFDEDGTQMHASADPNSPVVATVWQFGWAEAVCYRDDWTKVELPDVQGWVPSSKLFSGPAARGCWFWE